MKDLHYKWLIEDGELILGKVEYHKHLSWGYNFRNEEESDYSKILGGGWWYWGKDENKIYLYSSSQQFTHRCTYEEVSAALKKSIEEDSLGESINKCTYYFSESMWLTQVFENAQIINI